MEKREQSEEIHTYSGRVLVESASGSSSSESEGETSTAKVENVEHMTHSEDEDEEDADEGGDEGHGEQEDEDDPEDEEGDIGPQEENQEERGKWRCHYYPNCKEVFDNGQDWVDHKESTCPFRESERVPEESQDVNPPLPDTPRRTDLAQDLEISKLEAEEIQKYKCPNPNCPESFEDNEDLFNHKLNCEYRVSEGDSEFDEEANPPSPHSSQPSGLRPESPPSSSFNPSPASASGDQSEIQPIQEQEQPTYSRAKDVQHDKQKMKMPQCGACGELLKGTHEDLNDHTCSEIKCLFCANTLHNFPKLKEHYETEHSNETKFQCPYCNYPPNKSDEINFDQIKEHFQREDCPKGNYFKCSFCEETVVFKLEKDYIQHGSQYHFHGYQCCFCKEIIHLFNSYKTHGANHHQRKHIFKCQFCGELLNPGSGSGFLRRHVNKHLSERSELFKKGETPKTYQCPECRYEYVSEVFLRSHGKLYHGTEKLFKCSECRAEFTSSKDLETHENEKHGRLKRRRTTEYRDKEPDKAPGSKKRKSL